MRSYMLRRKREEVLSALRYRLKSITKRKGCVKMKKKVLAILLVLSMMIPFMTAGFGGSTVSAAPGDIPLTSFALHKSPVNLDVGKTATLSVLTSSVQPSDTTSTLEGTWSSDNTSAVVMTGKVPGQIRAVGYGIATITCEIDGVKASSVIIVSSKENPVQSFILDQSKINVGVGYEATLNPIGVTPLNASNLATVKWFTSNAEVVELNGNGQIKALKAGYSTITCQIGEVKAYCKVTVLEEVPAVEQGYIRVKALGNGKVRPSETFLFMLHEVDPYGNPGSIVEVAVADALGIVNFKNGKLVAGKQYILGEYLSDELLVKYATPPYIRVTAQAAGSVTDVIFNNLLRTPVVKPDNMELVEVTKYMFDIAGDEFIDNKVKLFDEYELVKANPPMSADPYLPPVNSQANANENVWRSAGASFLTDVYERTATFDMRREWQIFDIYVYDGPVYAPSTYTADGSAPYEVQGGSIKIYAGDRLLATQTFTNSGEWILIDLTEDFGAEGVTAQSLRFEKEQDLVNNRYSWSDGGWTSAKGQYVCDVNIPEVAIYGLPLGDDPPPEEPWELTPSDEDPVDFPYTIGQFMGTNSLAFDDLNNYENLSLVREYHNWGWTEYAANDQPDGSGQKNNTGITANPDVRFINSWNHFDGYYKATKERGVDVVMCIQGGIIDAPRVRPNFQGDQDAKKASSYLVHGKSMFQHAARYGSNKDLDPDLVRVAAGTVKEIGLDYVKYYENWNEPNLGAFTGAQFAAMTSADYDGHMGTMGPDVGVKQADPNAVFVLGGLAHVIIEEKYNVRDSSCLEFVKDMMKWFDQNRTEEQWLETHADLTGYEKYPFDVISCHYYCPDGIAATGVAPEDDYVFERMRQFIEFCETYLPDKEVWLSEFGWDTNQGSPQSATVEYEKNGTIYNEGINPGLTGEEVQGRWLIREYLILAAAGIDRVQQFMLGDENSDSSNRFVSSGMLGVYGKKPSWFYVGTMRMVLDSTVFEKELETTHPDVMAYQFTETDPAIFGSKVIAIWAKTSINQTIAGYELVLPESAKAAQLVTLTSEKWGQKTMLDVVDGKVTIDVSEKPVFVVCMDEIPDYEMPKEIEGVSFLFREHFDSLRVGQMSNKNAVVDLSYPLSLPIPEVVLPDESSSLYVGPNDKVLKLSPQKVVGGDSVEFGNGDFGSGITLSADVARKMQPGHTYYFDYWFYCEETTTIPAVRYDAHAYTRYWLFANPVGGGEPGRIRGSAGNFWADFATFEAHTWNHIVVEYSISTEYMTLPDGQGTPYYMNGQAYFNDMTTPASIGTVDYVGYRAPYGKIDVFFTPWAIDHDNIATGTAYINNLMIYESEIGIVDLNNIVDPADNATAPAAASLSVGSENPVGGVVDVALPAANATNTAGKIYGWNPGTADTIRFSVTDAGDAVSTITINGTDYLSGNDYVVTNLGVLTIVVTTSEDGKNTVTRTFKINVQAPASDMVYDMGLNLMADGAMAPGNGISIYDSTFPATDAKFAPVVESVDDTDVKYSGKDEKVLKFDLTTDLKPDQFGTYRGAGINIDSSVITLTKDVPYILDYQVWIDDDGTVPMMGFNFDGWRKYCILETSWHEYCRLGGGNQWLHKGYAFEPQRWNRVAMKYTLRSDNVMHCELFINDMETPIDFWIYVSGPNGGEANAETVVADQAYWDIQTEGVFSHLYLHFNPAPYPEGQRDKERVGTGYLKDVMIYEGVDIANPDWEGDIKFYATAPSDVTLSKGSANPVGNVIDVGIPPIGGTNASGKATGWVAGTANTIKFTVTDSGDAVSTLTVNGAPYVNGADYAITSTTAVKFVVTTTETDKETAVRTFTVAVEEKPSSVTYLTRLQASSLADGTFANNADVSFSKTATVVSLDSSDPKFVKAGDKVITIPSTGINTDSPAMFGLSENLRNKIARDTDYVMDFSFWRDTDYPIPVLFTAGGGYSTKEILSANYHSGNSEILNGGTIPYQNGAWQRIVMKFRWTTANTFVYEIFANDMENAIGSGILSDMNQIQWLQIGFGIRYQALTADDNAYVKELAIYEGTDIAGSEETPDVTPTPEPTPTPGADLTYIMNMDISSMVNGAFTGSPEASFSSNHTATVVSILSGDDKYVKDGEKAIEISQVGINVDNSALFGLQGSVLSSISRDTDYILDMSFWRNEEVPIPIMNVAGGNWSSKEILSADYHSGSSILLGESGTASYGVGSWQRLVVKFRWTSSNTFVFSVYANDMDTAVGSGVAADMNEIQWLNIGFGVRYHAVPDTAKTYVKSLAIYEGTTVA